MMYIKKGQEPLSLTEYRQQPYATYEGYDKKDELREALLRDQGYLCAYCMRRITNENRDAMKIEHWKPQSSMDSEKEKMDFQIMLGVCDGCGGNQDNITTCDEHRHNRELKVNPLRQDMMETISYTRDGRIHSTDPAIDRDLNTVLNLNCAKAPSRIVTNRKNVYAVCIQQLMRLQPQGNWKRSTLDKVLRDWTEKKNGKHIEYAGVAIYLLKKYLAKCKM